MKTGAYVAVILAILVGAGFYLFYGGGSTENQEVLLTPQAEYFIQTVESETVARVGQPIEGFEPSMFIRAFPGIVHKDFDGVETEQGVYQVSNGAIVFILTDSSPEHSAARAITPSGMNTLLENISARLSLPIEDNEGIDAIISEITAVNLEEAIIGAWRSTDDENFTRKFDSNGTVTDTYDGQDLATSVGSWVILYDLSEEPANLPLIEGATYLKILFAEEALYFTISEISSNTLQLIYLDRGGALNFEREE
ncbi:hypothetical protein COU13_00640 [Candidatus Kaiserbacteria bacterium CG10_big_fil_rev_8_21_14_0_10_43_70]|uniref:Uncharacterized protein n=1 Tax=Candidatus Kaiserbacteria bacterium CG10_big_fil_rev_8_21_14_0_10_43_70 TaxID=1974605 RepID=A0A2H0UJD0_9BACT|nr:MAG: hypothetical protein COU13_00640 [Candidatus Kaiserbacteria bacterium CG10_big_fil_rev_8_21_14_0_10_43_70]